MDSNQSKVRVSTGDIKDSKLIIAGENIITIGKRESKPGYSKDSRALLLDENQGIIKHLAQRFQTHWNRIDEAKIRDWLIQFETPKRMQLALRLLERIDYVDDARIVDMLTSFCRSLPVDERERAVFVPFGSPGESSALVTYLCSRALGLGGITADRFQSLDTVLEGKEKRPICFVDDNISSGTSGSSHI